MIGQPFDIEVSLCRVAAAAREVKPIHVETLVRSIADVGLIQPISVRRHSDGFEVIAGVHRLMAYRQLGKSHIPALVRETDDIRAELALIDENLIRNELTPAERALAVAKRKTLYEALHPETRQGVAGGKARHGSASDKLSFAESTAQATGKNRRTVEREANRGETLGEDALRQVTGTSLDKGEELDALAKLAPEHRERLIKRAAKGEDVSARAGDGHLPDGARAIMGSRVEADGSLDYFPTPPQATRALIEVVLPHLGVARPYSVWEPACGEGHIAEVLREYCPVVHASDVFDYGYGDVFDYLGDKLCDLPAAAGVNWVITNPPFDDKALQFTLKALHVDAGVGVAMFVRQQWLEGIARYERLFKPYPPTLYAQFVERIPLCKGKWDPEGGTATAYCWLVWVKGMGPQPPFWIPPGQMKDRLREDDAARFTAHPVVRKQHSITSEITETGIACAPTDAAAEPASDPSVPLTPTDAGSPSCEMPDIPPQFRRIA